MAEYKCNACNRAVIVTTIAVAYRKTITINNLQCSCGYDLGNLTILPSGEVTRGKVMSIAELEAELNRKDSEIPNYKQQSTIDAQAKEIEELKAEMGILIKQKQLLRFAGYSQAVYMAEQQAKEAE